MSAKQVRVVMSKQRNKVVTVQQPNSVHPDDPGFKRRMMRKDNRFATCGTFQRLCEPFTSFCAKTTSVVTLWVGRAIKGVERDDPVMRIVHDLLDEPMRTFRGRRISQK